MEQRVEYDARYLTGIQHFNRGEYFDAHEVWEDLWNDCDPTDRRFYQSLIQAAVALYHWSRGNAAGAHRLFHSGRRYMEPYRPEHLGLDVESFWSAVEVRLGPAVLSEKAVPSSASEPMPRIMLNPGPASWPDADENSPFAPS